MQRLLQGEQDPGSRAFWGASELEGSDLKDDAYGVWAIALQVESSWVLVEPWRVSERASEDATKLCAENAAKEPSEHSPARLPCRALQRGPMLCK